MILWQDFQLLILKENNIWALFVHPANAIEKELYHLMLHWYFEQTNETVRLGTQPGTRAEKFYNLMGWKVVGKYGSKEIKFEMSFEA